MPNLKINQTSLNILQKFYTYIFNQAVKNGNTHEIQKNTPKHIKSHIFRNWIQK